MSTLRFAITAGSALVLANAAGAQGLRTGVPQGQMPSAGLCRVWIDGVPAGRQPRETDCATARRTAPANARIIYGEESRGRSNLDPRVGSAGRYDERADPRSPSYDPRFDPNSRVYDPRNGAGNDRGTYDPRRDPNSRVYDPRYDPNSRIYDGRARTEEDNRRVGVYPPRSRDKEFDKAERKREKEYEKAERKRDKHGRGNDDGDDRDDDRGGSKGKGRGHGHGHDNEDNDNDDG